MFRLKSINQYDNDVFLSEKKIYPTFLYTTIESTHDVTSSEDGLVTRV